MLLPSLSASYSTFFEDEAGVAHYDYSDVWTSYAQSALSQAFLWIALALLVILIGIGLFVRFKKAEKLKGYLTVAISLALGFAFTVIVCMLSLEFYDMHEKGAVFTVVLYPAVVLGAVVLLSAAAFYVATLLSPKAKKITFMTAASVLGAAFIAMIVCLVVYFTSGSAEENNGVSVSGSENLALYLSAAGLIVAIALIAVFFGKGDKKGFDSKSVSYAAICIAMSFALSYLKLWAMPQGGSVTFASLLPLMLYSYMFGVRKGVFAGMIYGILQAVQDPWIIHPAQFLLDYPIAFAGIGIAGMFAKIHKLDRLPQIQFALGAIAGSALRFLSHILSGVFAFSEYAYDASGNPMNAWIYSMTYNSFVFVDVALVIAAGILVFSSKAVVKYARKFNAPVKKTQDETPQEPVQNENTIDQ